MSKIAQVAMAIAGTLVVPSMAVRGLRESVTDSCMTGYDRVQIQDMAELDAIKKELDTLVDRLVRFATRKEDGS